MVKHITFICSTERFKINFYHFLIECKNIWTTAGNVPRLNVIGINFNFEKKEENIAELDRKKLPHLVLQTEQILDSFFWYYTLPSCT